MAGTRFLWGAAVLAAACGGIAAGIFLTGDAHAPAPPAAGVTPVSPIAMAGGTAGSAAAMPGAVSPASPFPVTASTAAASQPGPAERLLNISMLEERWANDPRREEKIRDAVAVTQMQDRITGLGETLPKLASEQQRQQVAELIKEMQAFAARGVLPKSEVDNVAHQLLAAVDPKKAAQAGAQGQPQLH
ncbi:hypothetical protein GN109_16600 [Collimonas pratensis]|uniref:hypothetical protein n=1 Tax=Collimonas pratensis TaxID=279113 RepID=UPI00143D3142|nr:hypothetical protein [Collimonas pratensis]NKI71047.1 hypothetical protein [Collimonas pratensis]